MTATQSMIQGLVLEVSILPAGSKLISDHPSSSTILNLGDVTAFDEAGGGVTILGVPYLYSMVDHEASTITLTSGLTSLIQEGTSVLLNPPGEEKWATIDQGLGEDMIIARVPHWLADRLPDGVREESNREPVTIAVQYDGWTVTDIIGLAPSIDAGYVTNIPPDFTSDNLAPTSSPQPLAVGGVGSFFISWVAVSNHDTVTYDLYGSEAPGFTKGPSTFLLSTDATSATVRTLSNGTPFTADTNYYFAIIARDIDGSATASLESSGTQMMRVQQDMISANYVYAGEVYANQFRSGLMTADITIAGSFATASSGQRSVMDSFGIRQFGPDGVSIITELPNAGNPKFTGVVNAFGLIVNNGLEFRGQDNLFAMGSITTLATTTSGSTIAGTITPSWEKVSSGISAYLLTLRSYHREADGGNPTYQTNFFGYSSIIHNTFRYNWPEITDASGTKRSTRDVQAGTMVRTTGGLRWVHCTYYYTAGSTGSWKFEILDPTTMTADNIAPSSILITPGPGNGSNALLGHSMGRCFSPPGQSALENNFAECEFNTIANPDTLTFRRWAVTDTSIVQQGSAVVVANPAPQGSLVNNGFVYGSSLKMGFPGADQNIWVLFGSTSAWVWTAAGVRLSDFDFPIVSGSLGIAVGSTAAADNSFVRFESTPWNGSSADQAGGFMLSTRYENIHWSSTDSSVWWLGYTWNDSNGVTHESDVSALVSITMPKRMRYTITVPNLPDPAAGQGASRDIDDVNGFRVYMARQATTPTRTQLWKQSIQPADLATTITYTTLPQFSGTTNPPATTGFIAQAPAKLQSNAIGADGLPKVLITGAGLLHAESLDISGVGSASFTGKAFEQLYYSIRSQARLSGGGDLLVSAGYEVSWSARFIAIAIGRNASLTTDGYFEIIQPSAGTVINGYGGATNKTVTAAGIPLSSWDTLWYEIPYGNTHLSLSGNFRITNYTTDFVVPNNWVMICTRNADGTDQVDWSTGPKVTGGTGYYTPTDWTAVTFQNSWVNYGAPYQSAAYRRTTDGRVFLRGLVKGGTVPATIFTLPVGHRPPASCIFMGLSNHATNPLSSATRIDITSTGTVGAGDPITTGSDPSGYLSLEGISFDNA